MGKVTTASIALFFLRTILGQRQNYSIVTSGSFCKRLTTLEDCETAARQLGLEHTTASDFSNPQYPPYCYHKPGNKLYFNKAITSPASCSSERNCLCRSSLVEASGYSLVR